MGKGGGEAGHNLLCNASYQSAMTKRLWAVVAALAKPPNIKADTSGGPAHLPYYLASQMDLDNLKDFMILVSQEPLCTG